MSEPIWEAEFDWVQQESLRGRSEDDLSLDEIVQREEVLSEQLGAYIGRWVVIKNSEVVSSSATLRGIIERDRGGEILLVGTPGPRI